MSAWIWVALICISIVFQHYYLRWTRDKILECIHDEAASTDLFIKTREQHYRQLFPSSWQFPAEVIFTETGLYIFRYIGLFGYTKIFVKHHCLYATEQDILPFLESRINNFRFIHQIESLQVNGRNVAIEFGEYVSWKAWPIRQYRFVLLNVQGNDEYRNLIRFQRYYHDILQRQRRNQLLSSQQDNKLFQKNYSESVQPPQVVLDKEAIMNGLTSVYKHERIWTIMQIWELDDINEQIMHHLKEISTTDPDLEVREAARELIMAR